MRQLSLFILLLLLAFPASATPYTLAQENCEFLIDLPSEPYKSKRCDPANPEQCHAVTSYTKVFNLDATVNFNITCNKAEDGMFENYSLDIMEVTLAAMAKRNNLDDFETGSQQFENAKQAVILGTGTTGQSDKVFTTQLWIGHESIMTIEGELIGAPIDEADAMFANILKSVRHVSWKPEQEKEESKADE